MKDKNISFYLKKKNKYIGIKNFEINIIMKEKNCSKLLKIFFFQNYNNYAFNILLYLCIILKELFKYYYLNYLNNILFC